MRARLISLLAVALALAGCGRHVSSGVVTLTITRDFGAHHVQELTERTPSAKQSVRDLVRSLHAGAAGSVFVNGTASTLSAIVHGGDRVWLDVHSPAAPSGAVVGAFPEPFVHGTGGRRYPTTLACAADAALACRRVADALSAAGVPAATQELGTGSGEQTLAVVVGPWRELQGELLAALIDHGPAASGVYARFVAGGSELQLLDSAGRVSRTLHAGAGLIAAIRQRVAAPTWVVTGTDLAGVSAAAAALRPSRLRDRFALAVVGGTDLALPQTP